MSNVKSWSFNHSFAIESVRLSRNSNLGQAFVGLGRMASRCVGCVEIVVVLLIVILMVVVTESLRWGNYRRRHSYSGRDTGSTTQSTTLANAYWTSQIPMDELNKSVEGKDNE